jgi:hypothetical protein
LALPTLGWTVLSRDALRRADAQLREDTESVRDEIGFLNLHQAYANRFFPGTTVLQTRLRYIFFVPWMYENIILRNEIPSAWRAIQEEEMSLVKRLRHLGLDQGVIGGRSFPKPTSQPAAMVYWIALQSWGILRKLPDGSYPSRGQVHQYLQKSRRETSLRDDDHQPLSERHSLFVTLPDKPENWVKVSEPLDFNLTSDEAKWIRSQLMAITRQQGQPSVLALLAEYNLHLRNISTLWSQEIMEIVDDEEKQVVQRASHVSALAAIGRAAYQAMVEMMCDQIDQLSSSTTCRDFLYKLVKSDYAERAIQLDVDQIQIDAPHLIGHSILRILAETQEWLRNPIGLQELLPLYRHVEVMRKGRRAQLAENLAGKQRRAEWQPDENPQPSPLHYRWGNVQRLLSDLEAGL